MLKLCNKISIFLGSRATQRILRCEDTYGSPESPLSKMDILTVSEWTLWYYKYWIWQRKEKKVFKEKFYDIKIIS